MNTLANLSALIAKHLAELKQPGVLAIRPGYRLANCWPTQEQVVVVTVMASHKNLRLPEHIEGVPVDIRTAGAVETLSAQQPERMAQLAIHREEFRDGAFPTTENGSPAAPAAGMALAALPKLAYTPPAHASLAPVSGSITITCHASPDAGWPTLRDFLQQTASALTVGMYDFTSKHILDALEGSLAGHQTLALTLDNPARNPTADQTDAQTRTGLSTALADRCHTAWALVRSNKAVSRWIFPSAYHIKVAVRDRQALWLSSGNWNNSNQPEMDPIKHPKGKLDQQLARKSDRDWHVIIEHAGLAQTYEQFLRHDFEVASQQQASPDGSPGLLAADELAAMTFNLLATDTATFHFHAPLRLVEEPMRITPLLTPDAGVYQSAMLALISSAQNTLFIQLQYIHPSDKPEDAGLTALVDAVAARIRAGVDVRLILSQWQVPNGWLDRLQAAGIDLQRVKLQQGVHNKGFVVDARAVALGSQNWSGDGVLRNRDASVIIENDKVARYYEQIFLHDWERLAKQSICKTNNPATT